MAAAAYGAGDPTAAESERTAFRRAEKEYKLYKSPVPKSRKKVNVRVTDLSEVIDFRAVVDSIERGDEISQKIVKIDSDGFDRTVFGLTDHPGFYFIPNALTTEEQCHWIRESLKTFPQPPNRTNLTAIYGPIYDLFNSAQNQKNLSDLKINDNNSEEEISAAKLLRKLRWSTLGLQFDWSMRNYNVTLPHNKIPDELCNISKKMARPAMSAGEEFRPEAAIVNYYGPSDMLGGHVDDMEADWTRPIVSISLGCKAVFLLGGKTRDEEPIAMYVRSGDIILMANQARECFHGVPRIFSDGDNSDIDLVVNEFMSKDEKFILEYVRSSRININIRQVN
ncbi:hypothetical protein LUZ60_007953 [Juncus effusus]|nr:hypothetical protein LUZ60_007953 [Juncus effusus]